MLFIKSIIKKNYGSLFTKCSLRHKNAANSLVKQVQGFYMQAIATSFILRLV